MAVYGVYWHFEPSIKKIYRKQGVHACFFSSPYLLPKPHAGTQLAQTRRPAVLLLERPTFPTSFSPQYSERKTRDS